MTEKEWQDFIKNLEAQGLSRDQIQIRIDQKQKEIDTAGKTEGGAEKAVAASPENVTADTGSPSEEPSLELSLDQKIAALRTSGIPNVPSATTVDAFGGFMGTVFEGAEGLATIPSKIAMGLYGGIKNITGEKFGPDERKLMLKLLSSGVYGPGGTPPPSSDMFGNISDWFRDNLTKDFQKKYGYSSITEAIEDKNWDAAGEMTTSGFFASAPYTIAAMFGPVGLILMGGSLAGTKFREEIESGNDASLGTIITNAGLTGTNEALFDKYTAGLFSRAKRVIGPKSIKDARDILKKGLGPVFRNLVKGTGRVAVKSAGEAVTESLTEIGNAFIDNLTFDENLQWKDIKHQVIDAGILGSLMGGGISVVEEGGSHNSYVKRRAEELLMTDENKGEINKITAKVLENLEQLQNADLTYTQIKALNQENVNLLQQQHQITKENVIQLYSFDNSELNTYAANAIRMRDIKELSKIEGVEESTKDELKKEYEVYKTRNKLIRDTAVEREGYKRYEEFANTLEKAKGIQNLLNIKIKRFSDPAKYDEYIIKKKGITDKEYLSEGRVQGFFDSKNNEIILPDFKVEGKIGMDAWYGSVTPTHEIMHAIVRKIIGSPELKNKFGGELYSYLQEIGSGYFTAPGTKGFTVLDHYKKEARTKIEGLEMVMTKEDVPGSKQERLRKDAAFIQSAEVLEELMARTSDAAYYGLINENNSVLDKINNLFKRMSKDLVGIPYSFDTGKDVFEFIKGINTDLERGRLSWAMRKTLKKDPRGKLVSEAGVRNLDEFYEYIGEEHKHFVENADTDDIREMFKQYMMQTKKGLTEGQMVGGAMAIAPLFKKIVEKKLYERKHNTRPDFDKYKDIIVSEFLLDDERGITNLIRKHAEQGGGGTLDGYVNTYFPRRLDEYTNKFLPPLSTEEKQAFDKRVKEEYEKVGPDPSEIEEQLASDKANFKVNTVDKLKLSGSIATIARDITGKAIVLNIKDINKQAGHTFRGSLKEAIRRKLSMNGSVLDIELKGKTSLSGAQRIQNFEKWLLEETEYVVDGKKVKKKNIESLYEIMDVEDFLAMKKSGQPFIIKVKDATGKVARTDKNYAGYKSGAGNTAAVKKPYSQVKNQWEKFFILQEGEVSGTSEYRVKTETNYRRIRDILSDKIGADQLNWLINNDQSFRELLDIQGHELTKELLDRLKRNLRQGQFGIKMSIDATNYLDQNPGTILDILNAANDIENDVSINKMSLGKAVVNNVPGLPAEIAIDLEIAFNSHHIKESRDFDNENRKKEVEKYKSKTPSKRVGDMVDAKSGRSKKIKSAEDIDRARAYGEKIGFYKKTFKGDIFLPHSAEDFEGLLYNLYRKGKKGEEDKAWVDENLIMPYFAATEAIDTERLKVSQKIKEIGRAFDDIPGISLDSVIENTDELYTVEQAVRIWNMHQNFTRDKIKSQTGMLMENIDKLIKYVEENPQVKLFAKKVQAVAGVDGYPMLDGGWRASSIAYDLVEVLNNTRRARYLESWNQRMAATFTPKVRAKMMAEYGKEFMENFDNIITRMNNGRSKLPGESTIFSPYISYINQSQGVIMFLNARSAALQLISSTNFINWDDNNILAAGKAFANQDQYWKDVYKILNSDFLKARREGTTINIVEEEFIRRVRETEGSTNKFRVAINFLLDKGYVLTRSADSMAIAAGGATFYRNRKNRLLEEGMSEKEAEAKAWSDFRRTALKSQQSSDQALISGVQASEYGRLIYAFANTPFQYSRLMKKSARDLIAGRGNPKEHLSKIIYYGVVQNATFNALQGAMFALLSDRNDDDDELVEDKMNNLVNGMVSSILRGSGKWGIIADVGRSIVRELNKSVKYPSGEIKSEYMQNVTLGLTKGLLDVSPPLDHKARKLIETFGAIKYNEGRGWYAKQQYETAFPAWVETLASGTELVNFPGSRILQKLENLNNMFYYPELDWATRIAMAFGWNAWNLGIEDTAGLLGGETYKKKLKIPKIIEGPVDIEEQAIDVEETIIDVN